MKKKIWIGLTVLIILLIGTSFAWWYWNSTTNTDVSLTVDGVTVTFDGGQDITGVNLIPVSSKEKGIADNTAIEKVMSITSQGTTYMNLYMTLETLPEGLKDKSFVYELYKGASLVKRGNFAGVNQGDVITLLNHSQVTSTTQSLQLYIWIDGTQNNPSSMMNQTFKFVLNAEGTSDPTIYPNEPNTSNGLIPVTYSNNKWVKADSTNANNSWYNYDNKQWANAVAVSETNRDTYKSASAGTEIAEDDVLAYYVWIPRYKYKVWNITKTVGTDSYNARTTGIDIMWESGTDSTGDISCTYDFKVTDGSLSEKCNGSNGEYYTHPAFWWDTNGNSIREAGEELTGIWVGKYEISAPSDSICYETPTRTNCSDTTLSVRVKPNVNPWRYNYLSNFSTVIQAMSTSGNEYGIATNAESHMLKNMEWGAVAYLTNSDYGRCSDGICKEISLNSYYGDLTVMKTGCGPQSATSTSYGNICNEYNSDLGKLASTTGNIYGIYDMSGGNNEHVMGNMSNSTHFYTYYVVAAQSNFSYSATTARYIDTYATGNSKAEQKAYNRSRLGDATGEVVLTASGTGGWYEDGANFVYSSMAWFVRGGKVDDDTTSGIFNFEDSNGGYGNNSARAALLAF